MGLFNRILTLGLAVWVVSASPLWAAFTYPSCGEATEGQFREVNLIPRSTGIDEPMKMAFDMDANGNVDIYFVERKGAIKKYDAKSKALSLIGKVAVSTSGEDGLTGLALDPNFKKNGWMYVYYARDNAFNVTRLTYDGSKVDMGSEKKIISSPCNMGGIHTSGAMQFDGYGDLWIAFGDDGGAKGPASTTTLLGGISRIHPDDSPKGYSVPAGNFAEVFGKQAEAAGNAALASKYRDGKTVLPEIYVKGTRNAYTLTVDPVRRWLTWGDIGPDGLGGQSEEYNLRTSPGYMGWPYFAGDRNLTGNYGQSWPVNDRVNTKNTITQDGLSEYPLMQEPIYKKPQSAAITGPIYRYDGDSKSTVKFPPHFNGKWFITDFNQGNTMQIHVVGLDDKAEKMVSDEPFFRKFQVNRPLDMQMGPDGALYVNHYDGWGGAGENTSIRRIEYTGDCHPAEPKLERVPTTALVQGPLGRSPTSSSRLLVQGHGAFTAEVFDLKGNRVFLERGTGEQGLQLPPELRNGTYVLRLTEGTSQTRYPISIAR